MAWEARLDGRRGTNPARHRNYALRLIPTRPPLGLNEHAQRPWADVQALAVPGLHLLVMLAGHLPPEEGAFVVGRLEPHHPARRKEVAHGGPQAARGPAPAAGPQRPPPGRP